MTLRFQVERRFTDIRPSPGAASESVMRRVSELRRDPLTHRSGRVAHFAGFKLDAPDLSGAIAASRPGCPFCPERILQVTPLLPVAVSPEGRIRRGEALVFPNISPYDRHSVVITLTRAHYLAADQFLQPQLADGVLAAAEYFSALPRVARGTHSVLTWNYMSPAGATQVHPHLQAFSTNRPGSLLEEEVRRSRGFWRRRHHPYWEELAQTEQELGERFVARARHTVWLTAFVSRSVISDLLVLFPGVGRLEELPEAAVQEFAMGLRSALTALHEEGVRAFNLAFYAAPAGESHPHFWLHVRVSPRLYFNPAIQGSDATSWQHLLDEPFMVRSPEALAERLHPRLGTVLELQP